LHAACVLSCAPPQSLSERTDTATELQAVLCCAVTELARAQTGSHMQPHGVQPCLCPCCQHPTVAPALLPPSPPPSNPGLAVHPADSRVVVFSSVDQAHRLWIKGRHFTVGRLLGPGYDPAAWQGAAVAVSRWGAAGKTGVQFVDCLQARTHTEACSSWHPLSRPVASMAAHRVAVSAATSSPHAHCSS
jgi:hypothetical protein